MAAATVESGGSGGPYKGILGRHIGYTGDPEVVAQTSGSGYALLIEGQVAANTRNPVIKVVTSLSAAGAVTLAGVLAGDAVISVTDQSSDTDVSSSFESTISVNGQIQQTASTSGHAVYVVVWPKA